MNLISYQFAIFVILCWIIYQILPERYRKAFLLIASLVYYATWDLLFPVVMAFLALVNFWAAGAIRELGRKKAHLWFAITGNLASLLILKYGNAFPDWVGGNIFALIFPIGYSFRILEAISYQVDIYSGRQKKLVTWLDLAFYLFYFPKLLAGPIEKASQFLRGLESPLTSSRDQIVNGSVLVIVGVVRKVIIADTLLAIIPNDVFTKPEEFLAPELILWILTYSFYLYNDFCGYTDMIRGVSTLFGLPLSRNFAQPFFAKSFNDFWTRWHISLSSWLRDYVYLPLTRQYLRRNQGKLTFVSILVPTSITMVLSGLWHGIQTNFLLWGFTMAIYQVGEQLLAQRGPGGQSGTALKNLASRLLVLSLVIFAGLFFRMDVTTAWKFIQTIFAGSYRITNVLLLLALVRVLILVLPSIWLDWYQLQRQNELVFLELSPGWRAFSLVIVFYAIVWALKLQTAAAAFVYQGF